MVLLQQFRPVHSPDYFQGLHPVTIEAELQRIVVAIVVRAYKFCIGVMKERIIHRGLLEVLCNRGFLLVFFGLSEPLEIEIDILEHGIRLLVK